MVGSEAAVSVLVAESVRSLTAKTSTWSRFSRLKVNVFNTELFKKGGAGGGGGGGNNPRRCLILSLL